MTTPLRGRIRARLIPDLRRAWRFASVQISTLGAGLMAGWSALPADVRAQLPYANQVAAAMFALVVVARLVGQERKA